MCGESGLIRERLQGREGAILLAASRRRRGKSRDSLQCMHICNCMHRSLFAETYAGAKCHLRLATCTPLRRQISSLWVSKHGAKFTLYENESQVFGQCRMRWLRLGIPTLLSLRRQMPRPIKQVRAGMIYRGATQTAVPASHFCFNTTAALATCRKWRAATVACHRVRTSRRAAGH